MPKVIGGLAALVALFAGIFGHVDPIACMGRAALAFFVGSLGYHVWYALITSRIPTHRLEFGGARAPVPSDGTEQ